MPCSKRWAARVYTAPLTPLALLHVWLSIIVYALTMGVALFRRLLRRGRVAAMAAIAADLSRLDGRASPDALVAMGAALTDPSHLAGIVTTGAACAGTPSVSENAIIRNVSVRFDS